MSIAPTRIGFGGANLGNLYHAISHEQARALLDRAWSSGIRSFDTAPHYGLGLSERRLGRFLRDRPRTEFTLSTKAGRRLRTAAAGGPATDAEHGFEVPADQERFWDFTRAGIRAGLQESLERLGLDRVDTCYLHDPERSPDPLAALRTGVAALTELREEGVVQRIGVGSMSARTLIRAAEQGGLDELMVAGRLTLLEWSAPVVDAARAAGAEIVAAGVFNSGLLASAEPGSDARYEYEPAPPELLDRARRLAAICRSHGTDLPTAALQFPLRDPAVGGLVIGAGDPQQLTSNLDRLRQRLPEGLWADLAAVPRA